MEACFAYCTQLSELLSFEFLSTFMYAAYKSMHIVPWDIFANILTKFFDLQT